MITLKINGNNNSTEMYSFSVDDNGRHKKTKGVNANVIATIIHNKYRCLKIFMMLYSLMLILSFLMNMVIIFIRNDPDTIVHVRLLAWCNKFEKRKAYKKR